MATDRLNVITTPIKTVITVPTFDWSRNDFNFNVPVVAQKDLTVNGATNLNGVNKLIGATTLSGATTFSNTATFSNAATFNGTTTFKNSPTFTNGLSINTSTAKFDGNTMADYIVETGSQAMDSNGTWKWQKWKSGKAECWGKRNFGNTGFGSTFVSTSPYLFMSETFSQALPNIFNTTPDVIDITVVSSTNSGIDYMWVVKNDSEEVASASNTGGFTLVKRSATTVNALNLGFHIVGTWK